jgi:hypothetical protein
LFAVKRDKKIEETRHFLGHEMPIFSEGDGMDCVLVKKKSAGSAGRAQRALAAKTAPRNKRRASTSWLPLRSSEFGDQK